MAEPLLNPDPDAPSLVGGEYGAPAFQSVEGPSGERTVGQVPRATMVQPAPLGADFGVFHDLVPQERPQVGGVDFGVFSDLIPKPPPSITPASDAVVASTPSMIGRVMEAAKAPSPEWLQPFEQFLTKQRFTPQQIEQAIRLTPYGQAFTQAEAVLPTNLPTQLAGGALKGVSEAVAGQSSIAGAGLLAAIPEGTIGRAVAAGFTVEGLRQIPELYRQYQATDDPAEKARIFATGAIMLLPALGLKGRGGAVERGAEPPPLPTEVPPTGPAPAAEPAEAMRPPPETPTTEAAAEPTIVAEPAPETPAAAEQPPTLEPAVGAKATVFGNRHEAEVFDSIVSALPVDVVDNLGGKERAAQVLLHDQPMLINELAAVPQPDVAAFTNAVMEGTTRLRAEAQPSIQAGGGDVKLLPTLEALNQRIGEVRGAGTVAGPVAVRPTTPAITAGEEFPTGAASEGPTQEPIVSEAAPVVKPVEPPPRVAEPPLGGETKYMHPSERPEVPKITEVPPAEAAPAITPERELLDSLSGGKAAPFKERVSDAAKGIIEAAKQHVQSSQRQGLLPPGSEHIQNAIEGAQGVIRQIRGVPKFGDFQRGLNKFGSLMQRTNLTANELAASIRKQVPKKLQREAVFTYMDAGGDQAKLAAWAADPKAGPEYKAALKLTPQQKALADSLTKFFDQKGAQGQAAGVLKDLRSDYINRVVDTRKTQKAGGNPNTVPLPGGRLSKSFKFAQQRFHDYAYDAERNGVKYLTKDPAELIPIYLGEMNKTIGTKDFITSLTEGKASDSRPLAYPQGMGRRIMMPEGEVQARLIKPDFRGRVLDELTGEDVSSQDYQTLNHPALTKYKWVDTAEGKPVMVQGDLALHPEIAHHVKNILGTSAIRKWYRSPGTAIAAIPKAIVRTVDQVNQTAKQFLFSGSGFHHVTMGKKAFDVGARPIKNFFESLPAKAAIKADDPRVIFWSEHGSQLAPDRVSAGQFMEGFGGRTVERIPIYGKYVKTLSNHLFERFIPAMKLTLNEKYYAKNTKLFAKELARNEVNPDQLAYLSARQANEAMSHINYMDIGRNPTLQHIFSLGEIAPDFLESRTRFTARALGGLTGAKANRLALRGFVWGLAHTWVAARILNQLIDGDPHNDEPFGVVHNGRVYSMRTVYGDALHLLGGVYHATKGDISGLSQFTQARESALARAAQMLLTGVNYRGEKADGAEAAREFIATFVPIWAKGMPGLRNLTKSSSNNPVPPIEQFMGAWGMHSRRYSPITQTYQMASEYKTAQGIPKDVGVYPTSKYQQLRYALEDDDQEKAKAEFEKLLQGQPDRKKVLAGFHESLMHPFTESKAMDKKFRDSLEEGDRKVYDAASERRKEIMRRFNEMKAR